MAPPRSQQALIRLALVLRLLRAQLEVFEGHQLYELNLTDVERLEELGWARPALGKDPPVDFCLAAVVHEYNLIMEKIGELSK